MIMESTYTNTQVDPNAMVFFVDPNRERFGGFQPSEALEVEERFNESWTQKHGTKSFNTHDHTSTLQGVPNGWERVPLSNLLGFKHHPLEGAGRFS